MSASIAAAGGSESIAVTDTEPAVASSALNVFSAAGPAVMGDFMMAGSYFYTPRLIKRTGDTGEP